jgi:hypothetical protein
LSSKLREINLVIFWNFRFQILNYFNNFFQYFLFCKRCKKFAVPVKKNNNWTSMKYLKIAAIVLFVAFVAIQFYRPDFTNPPIVESENLFAAGYVPENVKAILVRSCSDCHSNETVYPWYSNISPSSWFLADHIDLGRSEMNFSKWNTYETGRKDHKLDELCEMVESRNMPLPSYLWIHWGAKLSDEEIKTLCDWSNAERQKLKSAQ